MRSLLLVLLVKIEPSFHFVLEGFAGCLFLHCGMKKPHVAHASRTEKATAPKMIENVVPPSVLLYR